MYTSTREDITPQWLSINGSWPGGNIWWVHLDLGPFMAYDEPDQPTSRKLPSLDTLCRFSCFSTDPLADKIAIEGAKRNRGIKASFHGPPEYLNPSRLLRDNE